MARLEDVTEPAFLDGLETWSLDALHAHRDQATELETGLSYLRRIVQGTLDILQAERERRLSGEGADDASDLVERLPSILSEHVRAPGLGRLPANMGPGRLDPELEARLDEAVPPGMLGRLPRAPDSQLASALDALTQLERSVSSERRAVLDVMDRLEEEIVRRYRTGEASVDNLLS